MCIRCSVNAARKSFGCGFMFNFDSLNQGLMGRQVIVIGNGLKAQYRYFLGKAIQRSRPTWTGTACRGFSTKYVK